MVLRLQSNAIISEEEGADDLKPQMVGEKNRKHDGNMAVLFVSCIDLRNIKRLVSSSFDTDDVFISSAGV